MVNALGTDDSQPFWKRLAQEQLQDESTLQFQDGAFKGITAFRSSFRDATVLGDVSAGCFRPFVPLSLRRELFTLLHGLAHQGVKRTKSIISERFVWPGLARDVTEWCTVCDQCQRNKVHVHAKAPLEEFSVPTRRFQHVHVDIVGPLPENRGQNYLFTIIDRHSRTPQAVPMVDSTAESCALAFWLGWVQMFGVPETVTSDRGAQFCSLLWQEMADVVGFQHCTTTSYHPQSNGLVERFHRTLKAALRARLGGTRGWLAALPVVLLALRATPGEDGFSPARLAFGQELALPLDLGSRFRSRTF